MPCYPFFLEKLSDKEGMFVWQRFFASGDDCSA